MQGKQAALGRPGSPRETGSPRRPWNMLSLMESNFPTCFTLCLYSLKLEKLLLSPTPWSLGRYLSQLLLLCIAKVCRASGLPVAWIQGSPASQPPSQPCESRGPWWGEVDKVIPVDLEAGAQNPPDAVCKLRVSFYFAAVIIIYHYYW